MAPRRSLRSVGVTNNNNYNNLTLNDVLCPICRTILIEPVTLPCNHGFCSVCFEGTIANTNLVCPLCRVRIGSWLRTTKKDNKLVNNVLWGAIQKTFSERVKNKLAGVDEYPEEDVRRHLTAPGEIRREYEQQKSKEDLELKKQRDAEAKASEDYIRKLKEQEQYDEAVREENLRLSEQVANQLAKEYCFDPGPSSSKSDCRKQGPIDRLLKNMTQKKVTVTLQSGPETKHIKEYTCKILCQDKNKRKVDSNKATLLNLKIQDKLRKIATEGEASDSNDSIDSECRYFKPIEQRYIPLSKRVPIIKVPAVVHTANTVIIGPPKGETNFTHTALGSAFAVVRIITLPTNISEKETIIKSKDSGLKIDLGTCDTTITELPSGKPEEAAKKYETRNNSSYVSPSKRKRLRSSPLKETCSPKKAKVSMDPVSPPFYGYNNRNLHELKAKTNGAIALSSATFSSKLGSNDIKSNLKKLQEEEDLKLAKQLHDELNNRGRYSTRNSISVQIKNVKKPTARQVTLKEIMSQTVSKIP